MRFLALIAVCLFALLAMTKAQLCPCPRNLDPVCGSDGTSYSNECQLNCEASSSGRSIRVVKQGEC